MREKKKAIWGWMMYDWAAQPFHTLIVTFIFAPYFAASVAATPAEGQELWGYAAGAGALIVAVLAPILGAMADSSGPRKPWILIFSAFYVAGSAALWFAAPETGVWIALIGFIIALIGVEFTFVFTNAMLPDLAPRSELGRISGSGWAFGYWGGLVSLVIVLTLMAPAPGSELTLIGLAPLFGSGAGEGARASGPMTALWYLVFVLPLFLWTPDASRKAPARGRVREGLRGLGRTLKGLPRRRSLSAFLLGSMFYRDALGGLYTFGGIYAAGVLGWGTFQLGVFGIIAAGFGAIGAWLGGRADQRYGPRPVIIGAMWMLIAVSALTISTTPSSVLFIALEEGSSLPSLVFYICGAVIGGAGGSLQAASRTMLVRQAEPGRMTEAFGIYALAGRATSFLAPFAIAVMTGAFASQQIGVTPVIALFALGLICMIWVNAGEEELQNAPGVAR